MNQLHCSFAKAATAFMAVLIVAVVAFALAPTVIGADASRVATSDDGATNSWVADAFPTGQATFARSDGHGR